MGEVYRAKDTRLGRDVAIKVLPESFARDGEQLRRFEQEAQAIAVRNHPNILAIHDIGEQNGAPYLVSSCWKATAWGGVGAGKTGAAKSSRLRGADGADDRPVRRRTACAFCGKPLLQAW
jgi:hypothetical protein